MSISAVFALAVALAMDAFAVCLATGICFKQARLEHAMRMAATFGFCQFIMPVIGWFFGAHAHKYIGEYDHWIAFGLLAVVGLKMIREGRTRRNDCEADAKAIDHTRGAPLLFLGIATSVDALAAGLSLALLDQSVFVPACIIGVVCFAFSGIGVYIGRFVSRLPTLARIGEHANLLGGLVLLAIGAGILREHGVF